MCSTKNIWHWGCLVTIYILLQLIIKSNYHSLYGLMSSQSCVLGVCHLALMLSARTPLNPREDFSSNDATLPQLLQEGQSYCLEHNMYCVFEHSFLQLCVVY